MFKLFTMVTLIAALTHAEERQQAAVEESARADESLEIQNGTYKGSIEVDGDIRIQNTVGGRMSIGNTSGEIQLRDIGFLENPLKNLAGDKHLTLQTSAGTFEFNLPRAYTSGNVEVSAVKSGQDVAVRLEMQSRVINSYNQDGRKSCTYSCMRYRCDYSSGSSSTTSCGLKLTSCSGNQDVRYQIKETMDSLKAYFISPKGTIVFTEEERPVTRKYYVQATSSCS